MQEVEAVHAEADVLPVGGHGHDRLGVVPGHIMVEVACDTDMWGVSEGLQKISPHWSPQRSFPELLHSSRISHPLIILLDPSRQRVDWGQ